MRGKIEFSRAQLVWCTYISSIEILMQRVLIRDRMERRKSEFVRFQFLTPLIRGGKNLIFFSRPGVMIVPIEKRYPLCVSSPQGGGKGVCKKIPRFLWPMIYRSDNAIHDTTLITIAGERTFIAGSVSLLRKHLHYLAVVCAVSATCAAARIVKQKIPRRTDACLFVSIQY